jgi:Zn-dependent oligopeptidases
MNMDMVKIFPTRWNIGRNDISGNAEVNGQLRTGGRGRGWNSAGILDVVDVVGRPSQDSAGTRLCGREENGRVRLRHRRPPVDKSLRCLLQLTLAAVFHQRFACTMLKTLKRRSWTCQQCLQRLQQVQSRRCLETAATSTLTEDYAPADSSVNKRHDDDVLRKVFDSRPFWKDFSQRGAGLSKRTGLVQNQYLTSPEGFREFAHASLQKCQRIVAKVLAASTLEEYRSMARDLDRLSDLLCRVIDLSDFMRSIHPDRQVQEAATQAYALMFEYMNVLNTTTGLNEQLKKAAADPLVTAQWTESEKMVAQILIKDFSNSAIHLPPNERQRFVNLSNDISQLGSDFVNGGSLRSPMSQSARTVCGG